MLPFKSQQAALAETENVLYQIPQCVFYRDPLKFPDGFNGQSGVCPRDQPNIDTVYHSMQHLTRSGVLSINSI